MPTITQAMLRRYSARTLEVLNRHKGASMAIAACEFSLGVSAVEYAESYDAAQRAQVEYARTLNSRTDVFDEVNDKLLAWLPLLRRDVVGISARQLGGSRNVHTDIVNRVNQLLELVDSHVEGGGKELPYYEMMKTELTEALAAATGGAESSGDKAANVKALQDRTRELAEVFRIDLVAFRAVIRAVLGRTHPDYRQLRSADRTVAEEVAEEEKVDPAASASLRMDMGGISDEPLELDADEDEDAKAEVAVAS